MLIGVCRATLRLPANDNLKGKRRVTRSISDRLRSRFNVAVAEVEDNHAWQILTLGIACVSNDSRHASEMLGHVTRFLENLHGPWELLDVETEIIPGF